MKNLSRWLQTPLTEQSGQGTLALALIMLALGAMIIPSLLIFTGTALRSGQVVESRMHEFYAADAGIEDAVWKIANDGIPDDQLPQWMQGDWDESVYAHDPYEYELDDDINQRSITVAIQPTWVLEGLEVPSDEQQRNPDPRLATVSDVIGQTEEGGIYQIGFIYDGSSLVAPPHVERIGCWLPPGFSYVEGSSNLEQDPFQPYYSVPEVSSYRNGTLIIWNFSDLDYIKLPGSGSKKIVTFEFTPYQEPQGTFSWMRTDRSDIHLSWDIDTKLYKITATATSDSGKYTILETYLARNEFRKITSASEGDYWATGTTLMRDCRPPYPLRDRLYMGAPPDGITCTAPEAEVSDIPTDAQVEKIYLYWSGWKCKPWDTRNYTPEQLKQLPIDKQVHKVRFRLKANGQTLNTIVEADQDNIQVLSNTQQGRAHGWAYSCYCDITKLVTDFFGDDFDGNGSYSVGHWDVSYKYKYGGYRYKLYEWKSSCSGEKVKGYTRYPLSSPRDGRRTDREPPYENHGSQDNWAYAAWSVIIVYSSPTSKGHQLYIYDEFRYCDEYETLTFLIRGFLAPGDVASDPEAARISCFVGEGDEPYRNDKIKIINQDGVTYKYLSDPPTNPENNVWNSKYRIGSTTYTGIDIDTFTVAGSDGIIRPGDTVATVELPTGSDSWNLIYIILSFRSQITTGGLMTLKLSTGGP